jgi:hypothetical protein
VIENGAVLPGRRRRGLNSPASAAGVVLRVGRHFLPTRVEKMRVRQFKSENDCAADRGPASILPFPLVRYPGLVDRLVREATASADHDQRNAIIVGHITVEFNRLIDFGVSVDDGSRACAADSFEALEANYRFCTCQDR